MPAYSMVRRALVRPQLMSGTHALHVALSGNLRPGDELLSPVGKPYDTLEEVIGIRDSVGSLKEYGVVYRQVDLFEDGSFDYEGIAAAINDNKTNFIPFIFMPPLFINITLVLSLFLIL